jgi:hypothetical protein
MEKERKEGTVEKIDTHTNKQTKKKTAVYSTTCTVLIVTNLACNFFFLGGEEVGCLIKWQGNIYWYYARILV